MHGLLTGLGNAVLLGIIVIDILRLYVDVTSGPVLGAMLPSSRTMIGG